MGTRRGYTKELDIIPKVDLPAARSLLAEAGFPGGCSVTPHCPNDRYVHDERICQAVASMLANIGIRGASSPSPRDSTSP